MAKPKYPPREGDEEIVLAVLTDWSKTAEPWVPFDRLQITTGSRTQGQTTPDGRWDQLRGVRLITVLRRLKRAGKVTNRMPGGVAAGTSEWRLVE